MAEIKIVKNDTLFISDAGNEYSLCVLDDLTRKATTDLFVLLDGHDRYDDGDCCISQSIVGYGVGADITDPEIIDYCQDIASKYENKMKDLADYLKYCGVFDTVNLPKEDMDRLQYQVVHACMSYKTDRNF